MFNLLRRGRPKPQDKVVEDKVVEDKVVEKQIDRKKIDTFFDEYPDPLLPFGILETRWDHFKLDQEQSSLTLHADRLEDSFIRFLDQKTKGFRDKRVLELGPYEAYHTFAIHRLLAREIIAIEGNPRNFLKCLIVKNHFQLDSAKFLLGNFSKYLKKTAEQFDFILAAGILYHQRHPMMLLNQMTRKSNAIGICTTLYDPKHEVFNMSGRTRTVEINGMEPITLYHRPNRAHKTKNEKHGLGRSAWLMTKESLIRYLEFRDFEVDIFSEGLVRQRQAPRIRLFAEKRR